MALQTDLDYNHEMQVGGLATMLSALLGGALRRSLRACNQRPRRSQ